MDMHRMASFPFMTESITYVKDHPEEFASITELASDILYEGVRELAMIRVHRVLEREEIPVDFHSPEECREEVLSYIMCRILIAATADQHLIRWYALAEAVRAQKLLSGRSIIEVIEVAEDIGFLVQSHDPDHVELDFITYITYGSAMKSYDWKLANQPLREGNVILSKDRFIRLIQEGLKLKFENEVTEINVPDAISGLFKPQLEEIMGITLKMKESYDNQIAKVVIPWRFPPCIHHLISMTGNSENVSHSGRFAMTSFLLHIGMTVDKIIDLFKVSPDFREDLARYQVEHIHGEISGTDYESMACKTMVSYGLCIGKDRLCQKIVHPLGYYEARNDDALPEEERRIRRALAASSEVARTLKIPIRTIQKQLLDWFREKAILHQPDTIEGPKKEGSDGTTNSVEIPKKGSKDEGSEKNETQVGPGADSSESVPSAPPPMASVEFKQTPLIFGAEESLPGLFRLSVGQAWLHGIKAIHPGTMETVYYVGTTGILEDATGRAVRLLPVLDFEHGQIIRDFQRTGKELDISGQIVTMSGRKFMHICRVQIPD